MTVVLGSAGTGQTPAAGWQQEESRGVLQCTLDDSGTSASCGELPQLEPAEDGIETWTTLGSERLEATLEPGAPQAAWAWELGTGGFDILIGGDEAAGNLLEGAIGQLNLVGVIEGWSGRPMRGELVLGPVEDGLDEGVRRPLPPGFTLVLPATMDSEGRLTAHNSAAWMPLGSGSDAPHLLMLDAKLEATTAKRGLGGLRLTARLPASSLVQLAQENGISLTAAAALVPLDMDWDGDGVQDSASVVLETQAQPVTLSTW